MDEQRVMRGTFGHAVNTLFAIVWLGHKFFAGNFGAWFTRYCSEQQMMGGVEKRTGWDSMPQFNRSVCLFTSIIARIAEWDCIRLQTYEPTFTSNTINDHFWNIWIPFMSGLISYGLWRLLLWVMECISRRIVHVADVRLRSDYLGVRQRRLQSSHIWIIFNCITSALQFELGNYIHCPCALRVYKSCLIHSMLCGPKR